jgi:putative pyruvate formate lyase activating enzyme
VELSRTCRLCPQECEADRPAGKTGACHGSQKAVVASVFAHRGEESCLSGTHGSGTIFFAACNLRCVFCQNYDLSHLDEGREFSAEQLAEAMLRLQRAGCHNINLVTPSHVVPQILQALDLAAENGLRLPLVYNTSSYDAPETLQLLDGVVDIYLADCKIWDSALSATYLQTPDYPDVARAAIAAMHAQVGELKLSEDGIALRGLLVRHLVMPGLLEDSRKILTWLADSVSRDTYVNVMGQYAPAGQVPGQPEFKPINRRTTEAECAAVVNMARQAGLWRIET